MLGTTYANIEELFNVSCGIPQIQTLKNCLNLMPHVGYHRLFKSDAPCGVPQMQSLRSPLLRRQSYEAQSFPLLSESLNRSEYSFACFTCFQEFLLPNFCFPGSFNFFFLVLFEHKKSTLVANSVSGILVI